MILHRLTRPDDRTAAREPRLTFAELFQCLADGLYLSEHRLEQVLDRIERLP